MLRIIQFRSMGAFILNKDLALEIIYDWAESVERIIGAGLKKKKVKISDTSQKNIRLQIIESLSGVVELKFYYRDALRFVDMGAGNGYHKGKKIGRTDQGNLKGRTKKKILNKPIYIQLARLKSQIAFQLIEETALQFANVN